MNTSNTTTTSISLYDEYCTNGNFYEEALHSTCLSDEAFAEDEKPSRAITSRERANGGVSANKTPSFSGISNYFEFVADEMYNEDQDDEHNKENYSHSHNDDDYSDDEHESSKKRHVAPSSVTMVGISVYYEYECDDADHDIPFYLPSMYQNGDDHSVASSSTPVFDDKSVGESQDYKHQDCISLYDEYGYNDDENEDDHSVSSHETMDSLLGKSLTDSNKGLEHESLSEPSGRSTSPTCITSLYTECDQ